VRHASGAQRYVVAVVSVAAGWIAREALTPAIGPTASPYITFFPAVAWAAWYGGLGPAVVSVALAALTANWFFVPPLHSLRIGEPVAFIAFPVAAILIVTAFELMHRSRFDLARSRQALSTTLTSIGDGVIVTDAAGRVSFLNPEAERLTGWPTAEAQGRPLAEVFRIVNERTRQATESPVERVLREGLVVGLANHTVLVARDGGETPIDDSAAPIREGGGPILGVVLVFRDVLEQRQAAQAQAQLAAIVESSGEAILAKGIDGTIQSWNAGAERLFGHRAEEMLGHSILEIVPPECVDEEHAILDRLRGGQHTVRLHTVRRAKDGRLVEVALTNSLLRDEEGSVVGASTILHDLTDVVAARVALERERDLVATTLSSIGDAVIATDASGRVAFLNPVAESLTGWPSAEAAGRPLPDVFRIVNEETRQTVDNPALRAMREGVIVGLANHTLLLARDGRELPISDSGAPIRDGHGVVVGAVLVFRDVTTRRRAERDLRRSEEHMRSIVEHVVDGILTIDESGTVETINRAAERLFGYAAREVVGKNVRMLMPEPFQGEHDRYVRSYLETGQAKIIGIGREVIGRRKDGSTFPMELSVSEFRVAEGRRFTGIVRDVSERRQLEEQLRQRVEELAEVSRRKSEFMATLAHELRNPLAPIRNSIALLQLKGPQVPELIAARDVLDRQVKHMTRLLDDLLDVNRLGRHKLQLRKTRVTLASVLESAVETVQPAILESRHQLVQDLPEAPLVLDADPVRLAQVFSNLLNNAAKYMDPGGRIMLSAAREGSDVLVSVRDEGIGIDRDSLRNVFEMFVQVPVALGRAQGGVGIGLALARGLVELHGGTISAHSDGPGRGSTFSVRLPLALGRPDAAAVSAPTPRRTPPRRVLIVDDLRDNADTLAMMLRAAGHEVHVTYDGASAVAAAARLRPEVALLDIGMPGVNGYEACRRIREQPWGRDVLLIAQTGWGQASDREKAVEAGFDRHLLKPVDCATLLDLLDELPRTATSS